MSAGGARRGRRDNGLDAAEFAVAGDVDPRVGEHLLDVLAAGGIAAYLQPASDLNPITRTTTMPSRPTDRLFVDRAHLGTARDYLARLAADDEPAGGTPSGGRPGTAGRLGPRGRATPGAAGAGGSPDIDAEWARIVASFHAEVDPATRPWPAAEHLDPSAGGADDPGSGPASRRRRRTDTGPDDGTRGSGIDTPGPDPLSGGLPPAGDGTGGLFGPPGPGTAGPPWGRPGPGPPGSDPPGTRGAPPDDTRGESRRRAADVPDADGAPTARPIDRRRPTPPDEPSLLDALDTFGADLPDDPTDDEGYTPPPPPPLPSFSKYAVAGVLAMIAGFVLFLFPDLAPLDPDVVMLFGFTCILAGFVTLIWRLRPGTDEDDDDPENGAVV